MGFGDGGVLFYEMFFLGACGWNTLDVIKTSVGKSDLVILAGVCFVSVDKDSCLLLKTGMDPF